MNEKVLNDTSFDKANIPQIESVSQTFSSLNHLDLGFFVPDVQKSEIELLTNMGQHRELSVSRFGTIEEGTPSTDGVTIEERAVELRKI